MTNADDIRRLQEMLKKEDITTPKEFRDRFGYPISPNQQVWLLARFKRVNRRHHYYVAVFDKRSKFFRFFRWTWHKKVKKLGS